MAYEATFEVETTQVEGLVGIGATTGRFWPVYFHGEPRQTCFTIHSDGTVTVDDWCRRQWFTRDFLYQSPGRYLNTPPRAFVHYDPAVAGAIVTFEVANGKAVYKIVERDDDNQLLCGELVQAEIDMPLTKAGRE